MLYFSIFNTTGMSHLKKRARDISFSPVYTTVE